MYASLATWVDVEWERVLLAFMFFATSPSPSQKYDTYPATQGDAGAARGHPLTKRLTGWVGDQEEELERERDIREREILHLFQPV